MEENVKSARGSLKVARAIKINRRNRRREMVKEIARLLFVPVTFGVVCFWLLPFLFPDSWVVEIAISIAVAILILSFNRKRVGDDDENPDIRRRLRNTIIASLGVIKVMALVNESNAAIVIPGPIFWASSSLIFFVFLSRVFREAEWPSLNIDFIGHYYYLHIRKIFAAATFVLLLLEACLNFGSLFVVIPALLVFPFAWVVLDYHNYRLVRSFGRQISFIEPEKDELVFRLLFLTPLALVPISIGYQFWSAETIFGLTWWQLSLVASAIFFIGFSVNRRVMRIKIRRRKEAFEKKRREEEEEVKREQNRRFLAKQQEDEKREEKIRSILEKENFGWPDFLDLIILDLNPSGFPLEIRNRIADLPLMDMVTVSHIKKRLIWNGTDLKLVLIFIADFFQHSFDDKYLRKVIGQVSGFRGEILVFKDYDGRKALLYSLKDNCRSILDFAEVLEKEEKGYF